MKYRLILILFSSFFINACVTPVTPQSMPWQQPIQHFVIKPVSPGLYQMDQFVVTYEGFSAMLQQELAKGHYPDVVILTDFFSMPEEEIRIAKLAEEYNLRVYTSGSFGGFTETSSKTMLLQTGPND